MSLDPGALMVKVEEDANTAEAAGDALHEAEERFHAVEMDYELEMSKARLLADTRYAAENGNKKPSAERRHDMALQEISETKPTLYLEYYAAKAELAKKKAKFKAFDSARSSRQTLLKVFGSQGG